MRAFCFFSTNEIYAFNNQSGEFSNFQIIELTPFGSQILKSVKAISQKLQ